jgi:hypothetical protein
MSFIDYQFSRARVEIEEKWGAIGKEMPFINWGCDFEVAVIPPFAGATARMLVRLKGYPQVVSIYCDHFSKLGCEDYPYFEILIGDETERYKLSDSAKMRDDVCNYLLKQKESK